MSFKRDEIKDPRVLKHAESLASAGTHWTNYLGALEAIREDLLLTKKQKRTIVRMVAQHQVMDFVCAVAGAQMQERL